MFWKKTYFLFLFILSTCLAIITPFSLIFTTEESIGVTLSAVLLQEFIYLNLVFLSFKTFKKRELIEIGPNYLENFKPKKSKK